MSPIPIRLNKVFSFGDIFTQITILYRASGIWMPQEMNE